MWKAFALLLSIVIAVSAAIAALWTPAVAVAQGVQRPPGFVENSGKTPCKELFTETVLVDPRPAPDRPSQVPSVGRMLVAMNAQPTWGNVPELDLSSVNMQRAEVVPLVPVPLPDWATAQTGFHLFLSKEYRLAPIEPYGVTLVANGACNDDWRPQRGLGMVTTTTQTDPVTCTGRGPEAHFLTTLVKYAARFAGWPLIISAVCAQAAPARVVYRPESTAPVVYGTIRAIPLPEDATLNGTFSLYRAVIPQLLPDVTYDAFLEIPTPGRAVEVPIEKT